MNEARSFSSRQLLFKELFVGTLIYTIVLGFFDDHTSIVEATSFSYLVFGDDVNIDGFFGIFAVALLVTVAHRLADIVFVRLGEPRSSSAGQASSIEVGSER